jgi:hypothetical protein
MGIAVKLLISCYTTINQSINQSLLKLWMVIHTRQYFLITYISQENWFNLIYSIFQDKSLPQGDKTVIVMDYLQLESHDWSLVYSLSCLPFHLLSFVVSCVFNIQQGMYIYDYYKSSQYIKLYLCQCQHLYTHYSLNQQRG